MTKPARSSSERFRRFAEVECRGSSPLYERLALSVASDDELLALAAHVPQGQPIPNLFFAAVHFLLLQRSTVPLAKFYPSLTRDAAPSVDAYPVFRAFCMGNAAAIRELLTTRRVQTNEVARCSYLFPAFLLVSALAGEQPLALIEIGTSAGLNLLWDRYAYRYDDDTIYGDARSAVRLACTLRGEKRPALRPRVPAVGLRIGIDLHVVDVHDWEETRWLEALVWPDERDRACALRSAVAIARESSLDLLSGDGVTLLPDVLRRVPREMAACVFHTHTINQLSPESRDHLAAVLAEAGRLRDVYRISAEWLRSREPRLELTAWQRGSATERLLANCDAHGRWLEWLDD